MEIDKYTSFNFNVFYFILLLVYQLNNFKINNPKSCLFCFKRNNLTGFLFFILSFLLISNEFSTLKKILLRLYHSM